MRKIGVGLLALALGISLFSGRIFAEEDLAYEIPRMASVQGWVDRVDWVGNKVVINTGGDQIVFVVDGNTKVQKHGANISINDLNQGDLVTVHFIDKKHTGLYAVSITDQAAL